MLWFHQHLASLFHRPNEMQSHFNAASHVRAWCGVSFINSSPPGQNGHHFEDHIFRFIFLNERFCILIKISLKFVPKGPIDNILALVEILAWHQIGDKPLSEPMLTWFTDVYEALWGDELTQNQIVMLPQPPQCCMWCVNMLSHKLLEMHMCVLNAVATDALVLKHQTISIHSAE